MNRIIANRKEIIEADVMELDLGGYEKIRVLRIQTPLVNWVFGRIYSYIVVEWYHPNREYEDFGFFYKTPFMEDWEFIQTSEIYDKYKTKEGFLKEFPEFEDLFEIEISRKIEFHKGLEESSKRYLEERDEPN